MTLRFFRADRHSMYFVKGDTLLKIEADIPSNDTWESHSLEDRSNPSHSKLLLESATWLEGFLALLNSSTVAGMPSNNVENISGTVLKGFHWLAYQEDAPYSDEFFNFFERSETLLDYVRKQNPPFNTTHLSLIIDFSSNTTSAAFSPELSSVEGENKTPNMQNQGNDIKNSTPENFK